MIKHPWEGPQIDILGHVFGTWNGMDTRVPPAVPLTITCALVPFCILHMKKWPRSHWICLKLRETGGKNIKRQRKHHVQGLEMWHVLRCLLAFRRCVALELLLLSSLYLPRVKWPCSHNSSPVVKGKMWWYTIPVTMTRDESWHVPRCLSLACPRSAACIHLPLALRSAFPCGEAW